MYLSVCKWNQVRQTVQLLVIFHIYMQNSVNTYIHRSLQNGSQLDFSQTFCLEDYKTGEDDIWTSISLEAF